MSFEPTYKYYTKEELYELCGKYGTEEDIAFRKRLVDAILSNREIADRYREDFIQERIAPIVEEIKKMPRHEVALMAISYIPYCDIEEILEEHSKHNENYVEPEESDIANPDDYLGKARIIFDYKGSHAEGDYWQLYYLSEKRFTAFYEYYDPHENPYNPNSPEFSGSINVENNEEYRELYEFFLSRCIPEKAVHGEVPNSNYFEAAVLSETRFDGRTKADKLLFRDLRNVETLDYRCKYGDGPEYEMMEKLFAFAKKAFAPPPEKVREEYCTFFMKDIYGEELQPSQVSEELEHAMRKAAEEQSLKESLPWIFGDEQQDDEKLKAVHNTKENPYARLQTRLRSPEIKEMIYKHIH